jgi:RNA polymerase sigma-70 factor (ECF subfamily)
MDLSLLIHDALPATRDLDAAEPVMSEAEFRAFYERTARPLWAYLLRVTRDADRTQDVHQEAYYRFYRAGARHESEAHRRNSLFRIATNLVRDAARQAKRRPDVPLGEEGAVEPLPEGRTPLPERRAAIRTDLGRAMSRLAPVQRRLLWLAYAEGASHEEIAEVLGLRAGSVRTLLFRARKRLAALLGAPGTERAREAGR